MTNTTRREALDAALNALTDDELRACARVVLDFGSYLDALAEWDLSDNMDCTESVVMALSRIDPRPELDRLARVQAQEAVNDGRELDPRVAEFDLEVAP